MHPQCNSTEQLVCYASTHPYDSCDYVKTAAGRVSPNALASQTVGKWGPLLLQDVYLIEKLQNLNRERIPVRIGHAKGAGE